MFGKQVELVGINVGKVVVGGGLHAHDLDLIGIDLGSYD